MPNFGLAQTVAGNVRALRVALGSVVRELSREALADLVAERHPDKRRLNTTTVARWESGESEPDLHSLRIMAGLAGVSLEQFAFGATSETGGGTIHGEPFVPVPLTAQRKAEIERERPGSGHQAGQGKRRKSGGRGR